MIADTPELRRILFIAQQRRVRYCEIIDALIPTEQNEEEWDASIARADDARLALLCATGALMDYLQSQIDG